MDSNQNLFLSNGYGVEHSIITVQSLDNAGEYTRSQVFRIAIQEMIVNAGDVLKYPTLASARQMCATNCYDYQKAFYYILMNGNNAVQEASRLSINAVYNDSKQIGSQSKTVCYQ